MLRLQSPACCSPSVAFGGVSLSISFGNSVLVCEIWSFCFVGFEFYLCNVVLECVRKVRCSWGRFATAVLQLPQAGDPLLL